MDSNTDPVFLPQSLGQHTCTADVINSPLDFEIQYQKNPEQRLGRDQRERSELIG